MGAEIFMHSTKQCVAHLHVHKESVVEGGAEEDEGKRRQLLPHGRVY